MKNNLLISLIKKNIVRKGTEIIIFRSGTTMDGNRINFRVRQAIEIVEIEIKKGIAFLTTKEVTNDKKFLINAKHIFKIDGMKPEILGGVYGFNSDGTKKKVKIDPITGEEIKRGRKPKKKNNITTTSIRKKIKARK